MLSKARETLTPELSVEVKRATHRGPLGTKAANVSAGAVNGNSVENGEKAVSRNVRGDAS